MGSVDSPGSPESLDFSNSPSVNSRDRRQRHQYVDDDDDDAAMELDGEDDVNEDPDVALEDVDDDDDGDEREGSRASATATNTPTSGAADGTDPVVPVKRGRGRPVGSGKKRHGNGSNAGSSAAADKARAQQQSQIPLDDNGVPYKLEGDELVLPNDPVGDEKVDALGNLAGGRDYRVRTFTIPGRGDKLYMLSTEPARCMGFRDSYLLFQKHRKLWKIVVSDSEKYGLIERDIIPHSYKGRAIGVVTARSVYLEFGAKIIIGGRHVRDDYYEDAARAQCEAEGIAPDSIADPEDQVPPPGQEYNKNQYVAWHGASNVYHQSSFTEANGTGAHTPVSSTTTGANTAGDTPIAYYDITSEAVQDETWMYEHAKAVSQFNSELATRRRNKLSHMLSAMRTARDPSANFEERRLAVEPYTGVRFLPKATQPKRVRKTRWSLPAGSPLVVSTVVSLRGRTTGLSEVKPSVYASADPELREAISAQLKIERFRD